MTKPTQRPLSRRAFASTAASAALVLTGCGADIRRQGSPAQTVTVKRCAEPVQYRLPQRVVAYEAGSADKLFILGLTEHVLGYVLPPANPRVSQSPWASEYAKVKLLSRDLLNRELVVDVGADMVVAGWHSGFSVERGITPEILDELGIMSFMHTESCYNYPQFPVDVPPFEALYTDLDRLGQIFRIEKRATNIVTDLRKRVATTRKRAPNLTPRPPVFLYDSGTRKPLTVGNQVPAHQIMEFAGARNIFADIQGRYINVSWESIVKAQPEIIIILDYQDKPAEEKIAFLKSFPPLRSVPAIRNNNFYILNYNEAISGPQNVNGLEGFTTYMRKFQRGR